MHAAGQGFPDFHKLHWTRQTQTHMSDSLTTLPAQQGWHSTKINPDTSNNNKERWQKS